MVWDSVDNHVVQINCSTSILFPEYSPSFNVFLLSLLFLLGRAFHHYRGARDSKEPLAKHPELDNLLREEYRSLDDFKRAKANNAVVGDVNH